MVANTTGTEEVSRSTALARLPVVAKIRSGSASAALLAIVSRYWRVPLPECRS